MNSAQQMFLNLAMQSPYYLAMLVGAVLAIVRWQRHPGVSAALLLAVAMLTVSNLGGMLLTTWLPDYLRERGDESLQNVAAMFGAVNLVRGGIAGIAWGLLLFAVFSGRPKAEML